MKVKFVINVVVWMFIAFAISICDATVTYAQSANDSEIIVIGSSEPSDKDIIYDEN